VNLWKENYYLNVFQSMSNGHMEIKLDENLDPLDERKARIIAKSMYELKIAGTAWILLEAKRKVIIEAVKDLLDEMHAGGYWIGDDILSHCLLSREFYCRFRAVIVAEENSAVQDYQPRVSEEPC